MLKIEEKPWLFEEFQDEGEGGSAAAQTFEGDDGSEDFEAGSGQDSNSTDESESKSPANPQIDPNLALQIAQQAMAQSQQQQQTPQQQLSREEIEQHTKYYRVKPEIINAILSEDSTPEQRLEAFQNVIDGVSTHASTVAGLAARMVSQQMQNQFMPIQEAHSQQVNERFVQNTAQAYPGLQPYSQVLHQIVNQMKAEGYQSPHPQMAMQEVANRATQFIRMANPAFDPTKGAQNKQTQGNGMPALAGEGSSSGASGAGGSSSGQGKKPGWADIFS